MGSVKKYDLIDLMKFIGSIMIIAMHMAALEDISVSAHFYGIQLITRWAVPFFFVTSAFFLYRKSNGEPNWEKTKGYVKRILILYGVWFGLNIVSIIYKLYCAGFGSVSTWLIFLRNLTTGSVYTAAWYLLASAFGALFVYWLAKRFSEKTVLAITLVIYGICTITSTYKGIFPAEITQWIGTYIGSTCNNIICGCFYFALGRSIAKHYDALIQIPTKVCWALLVLSYGLFYGEIILLKHFEILGTTDASLLLIPVALFLFLLVAKSNLSIKSAPYFRKMSTFIFCSQGTVNLAACLAAKILHLPFTYVEFLCSFVLMMILGSILIWLQKKMKWLNYLT